MKNNTPDFLSPNLEKYLFKVKYFMILCVAKYVFVALQYYLPIETVYLVRQNKAVNLFKDQYLCLSVYTYIIA